LKRIILGVFAISLALALAVGATVSQFEDTETSTGNTFTAGSLDLTVGGQDGPFSNYFTATNMAPGHSYIGGCYDVRNAGSLPGALTLKVNNVVSNENGEIEPELSDGDVAATEIDPSGYDANTGNGELWDQLDVKFFIDDGAGSHAGNGVWDWDDHAIFSNFGTPSSDYSGYYSLPLNTDLVGGTMTLTAGQTRRFCTEVYFVDDDTNWWWGGQAGLTNNMAMTDDVTFDMILGLVQIP